MNSFARIHNSSPNPALHSIGCPEHLKANAERSAQENSQGFSGGFSLAARRVPRR